MGLISYSKPTDGTTANASDVTNPLDTIYNEFNGNIDNSNISATAAIAGSKLADGGITATKLSASAITLGYAQITSSFTTSGSNTAVTGLSVTVTIPAGGRRVKITVFSTYLSNSTSPTNTDMSLWDGVVGSGTEIGRVRVTSGGANYAAPGIVMAVQSPSAGSKTYAVGLTNVGGTLANLNASTADPAFILVELI